MLKLFILVSAMMVADVLSDTCDTYNHPTYGKGKCVEQSQCPNSLYISNLCESKPASVKCCFSLGSTVPSGAKPISCSGNKLVHSTALNNIKTFGIGISSSGGCSDRNKNTCTSLDQVNCVSICALIRYKQESGCAITVTGGTEVGHAAGTYSHYNGYKIDMSVSTCHSNFITSRYTRIADRGDGAKQYKDPRGNIFALEGNHWDNTFYAC